MLIYSKIIKSKYKHTTHIQRSRVTHEKSCAVIKSRLKVVFTIVTYHVPQLKICHIKCSGVSGVNSVKCHNIVDPGVDTAKFQQLAPGLEMLPGHMSVFHTSR